MLLYMGAAKQRSERITFLLKYALKNPAVRDTEHLTMLGMSRFAVTRRLAREYAEVALARIADKGDLYGLSPEVGGVVKEDPEPRGPVHVFGAGMESPEGLKPLTEGEEKLILETPLEELLMLVPRPKPPVTDFSVVEEKED